LGKYPWLVGAAYEIWVRFWPFSEVSPRITGLWFDYVYHWRQLNEQPIGPTLKKQKWVDMITSDLRHGALAKAEYTILMNWAEEWGGPPLVPSPEAPVPLYRLTDKAYDEVYQYDQNVATGLGLDTYDADIMDALGEEGDEYGLTSFQIALFIWDYTKAEEVLAPWYGQFAEVLARISRRVPELISKGLVELAPGPPREVDIPVPSSTERLAVKGVISGAQAKDVLEALGFEVVRRGWVGLVPLKD